MAGLDDPDWDPMQDEEGDFEFLDPEDGIMEVDTDPASMGSVVHTAVPNNGHANQDEMSPPGTPVSLQQAVHEHSASGGDGGDTAETDGCKTPTRLPASRSLTPASCTSSVSTAASSHDRPGWFTSSTQALPIVTRRRISVKSKPAPESQLSRMQRVADNGFSKLSLRHKSKFRGEVRTWLERQRRKLAGGETVRYKRSGEVFEFKDPSLYEKEKTAVSNRLLYDLALDETRPALAGAAANRWLQAQGSIPLEFRKFSTNVHDDELIKQACVFLTWHGNFGCDEVKVEPLKVMTMAEIQTHVAKQPAVLRAWASVKNQFADLETKYDFAGVAVAMEICTRTWKDKHVLRLHLHAWIMQGQRAQRLRKGDVHIENAVRSPHFTIYGQASRKGMAAFAGAFYISVQKEGQVFVHANKQMHEDYKVKPDWVVGQYTGNKISYDTACLHIVKQVVNAKRYLADLEFARDWTRTQEMMLERERIISRVVATSKPFREVPEVREWEKQFDWQTQFDFSDKKMKLPDRFTFLVLEGPSKVGKTRYVQGALCAHPMQALILDCGDAVVPALHGNYAWGEHKVIMFDEAHAKMVIRCKKVFQSGINMVQVGNSPTNCFLHQFFLYGIKMVIGSNTWTRELNDMEDDDREWIKENSVHVIVKEALWIV